MACILAVAAPRAEGAARLASPSDFLMKNNNGTIVVFGSGVQFRECIIVRILDQFFTVVKDVPVRGGYNVENRGGERILTIN